MAKVSHSNPFLDDVLPGCQKCNDSGEYAISPSSLSYIAPGPVPEDSTFTAVICRHPDECTA